MDDSNTETIELKIPQPLENPSPRKPAALKGTFGTGSPSSQPPSTAKRQVRFVAEDRMPKNAATEKYESLNSGEDLRTMKYRVGNGGYLRRGSLPRPNGDNSHDEDRNPSRVLQALSEKVLESDEVGSIIPENPFGTIREREPFVRRTARTADTSSRATLLQYLPLLQFRTLLKKLYVSAREPFNNPLSNGLSVCDVADDYGDWCGSVTVPQTWIKQHQNKRLDFIAISEARSFTMDECPVWTYYVPKERLLERDEEQCWWERVALGKVFKAVFGTAEWAEIQLS